MAQNFVTAVNGAGNFGVIQFTNTATAGSGCIFTNGGNKVSGPDSGGRTNFFNASSAANGTFNNDAGAVNGAFGGETVFLDNSTAANATLTANGATVLGAQGGSIIFVGASSAGNATLIADGGLGVGGNGAIRFAVQSHGSKARVEVFGIGSVYSRGRLDLTGRLNKHPDVTIGSLEGNGVVFLGGSRLSVGSNNLDSTFSGEISHTGLGLGGYTPGVDSLTKIGTSTLTLTGANLYSGGTTIKRGKLLINNQSGSGTGTGPVLVNGGRLGGDGTIAGAVTVGDGSGQSAILSGGISATIPGTLTIESQLTFNSDATYMVQLNSATGKADTVVANGVTMNSGAQFSFADLGTGTLLPGTVFTVIKNTAAAPIAGTFSNLPDGSTFTSNGNTYQVSYEGGDGNDLTLTVQ
jgi:autotransporter-associated beta strand protein